MEIIKRFFRSFFILMGVLFLSVVIHEGFHLAEAIEPHSICYDFGKDSNAHVEAKGFRTDGEIWAYLFQAIFFIIVTTIIYKTGLDKL